MTSIVHIYFICHLCHAPRFIRGVGRCQAVHCHQDGALDSEVFSDSGGEVFEFTAASSGHIVKCSQLSNAPASFKVR